MLSLTPVTAEHTIQVLFDNQSWLLTLALMQTALKEPRGPSATKRKALLGKYDSTKIMRDNFGGRRAFERSVNRAPKPHRRAGSCLDMGGSGHDSGF
jgi:hypothetical protein